MKIRHIALGEHPVLLAPMEDVTDPAVPTWYIPNSCRPMP